MEFLEKELSASTLAALKQFLVKEPTPEQNTQNDANNNVNSNNDTENIDNKRHTITLTSKTNADYKEQNYWEDRFGQEEEYDWLLTFSQLKNYIIPYVKPEDRILVVGCGNSTFSDDLYDAGFHNIVNIDFSKNVILKMSEKSQANGRSEMQWKVMDMLAMDFENEFFDVVIDKASMDALMVDEGDVWDPNPECISQADTYCFGVQRILKSSGFFLQISFAQPHFRTKYLAGVLADPAAEVNPYNKVTGYSNRYHWDLEYKTIDVEAGCLNSYIYIMKK